MCCANVVVNIYFYFFNLFIIRILCKSIIFDDFSFALLRHLADTHTHTRTRSVVKENFPAHREIINRTGLRMNREQGGTRGSINESALKVWEECIACADKRLRRFYQKSDKFLTQLLWSSSKNSLVFFLPRSVVFDLLKLRERREKTTTRLEKSKSGMMFQINN